MTKAQLAEREEAREELRRMLVPGTTVYTVLRHVSASGMTRKISLLYLNQREICHITHLVGRALGDKVHDYRGDWVLTVSGCGMDMGFHLVHNLSYALHGFPGDDPEHATRKGFERRGYTLRHLWL